MSSKGTSRSEPKAAKNWWLGPAVVYLCMLAALILLPLLATPFRIERGVIDVVNQWAVYAIAIAFVYLHVRRYERGKKFWQSIGSKRVLLTRWAKRWGCK
jgi:hypothetical protein